MRASSAKRLEAALGPGTSQQAGTRTIVLLLALCVLGVATSAFWLYSAANRGPAAVSGPAGTASGIRLSDSTRAALDRLSSPLEIRFYALLDRATVPASLTAFAGRVGQLLSAYQQAAGGKVKVTSITSMSDANANAAAADGITAFNRDKGEVCYLGIALVLSGQKETLPRLAPEWEQALEPDLTRAIERLLDATRPVAAPAAVSQTDTNALQEVKALIPDVAAVSVEEGKRILREASLKGFIVTAKEMQAQVKEAEQRLAQARNGGTATEQEAATKHLQQVQAEQEVKLKQIAAESQAQIDAFLQLKAASH